MENRSKVEIFSLILEAARKATTKTEIMYEAFLTHDKLSEYCDILLERGLIEYQMGDRTYQTTDKGLMFLNEYSDQGCRIKSSSGPGSFNFGKVLIVGLGQLGLPVAKYVKERGFDTYGYDISITAMERAERIAGIKKADEAIFDNRELNDFDVYIISVSTHKQDDMFSPQTDGLMSVVEKVSRGAKNGALVSIESTIPKGTSKKVFELLNHRLHVVHAPHRWYALEEKEHGVNQLRVIGGVCDCCLNAGMQFYDAKHIQNLYPSPSFSLSSHHIINNTKNLEIPMHPVTEIEIAEITKVVENAHRYLQIAFAEELYLYCQANNMSFPELRDALNTKWNVNILEPREGIGGHCLPKDTKMFLQSSSKPIRGTILNAAIQADQSYRNYRVTKNYANEDKPERSISGHGRIELTLTDAPNIASKTGGHFVE
jgi:UDP-N-acetyl-D-mannosaminuronate dehydrogenase/predicted transcriptional regulator